ncbi:nucleotide exchange factor GrpE [Candidatus Saccharibacteria bacterium]|nr:nucleotide exchange factor GrpE [Candidatus Saccharibacteria bacterium]
MTNKISKEENELLLKINDLTADLQRVRADFENYRKRVEQEKLQMADVVKATTIMKLLPIVDDIERSLVHLPKDLKNNDWVKGVMSLKIKLENQLAALGVTKIDAKPGSEFDPQLHEAMLADEAEGDKEIIQQELLPGYKLGDKVIRHTQVKVTYK